MTMQENLSLFNSNIPVISDTESVGNKACKAFPTIGWILLTQKIGKGYAYVSY